MLYFIGAGPGAVDLITVRGRNLLEKSRCCNICGIFSKQRTFRCL